MEVFTTIMKVLLYRLKKPSTIISLVSQITSLLLIFGVSVNADAVITVTTLVCSILVILGILSNPDTVNKGYGDDYLQCAMDGRKTLHVEVNGQMLCKDCGAIHYTEA
jgi:uncharacterized membrane protein